MIKLTERDWFDLMVYVIERDNETDARILRSVVSNTNSPVMMLVRE